MVNTSSHIKIYPVLPTEAVQDVNAFDVNAFRLQKNQRYAKRNTIK